MLVADDDDFGIDGLETFEAEKLEAEREAALAAADAAAEPVDAEPLPEVVTREHFVLLPLVTKLIQAHAQGPEAAEAAMKELRRGVDRAQRMFGVLEASAPANLTAADEQSARELLRERTSLLSRHSRKRSLGDPEPSGS